MSIDFDVAPLSSKRIEHFPFSIIHQKSMVDSKQYKRVSESCIGCALFLCTCVLEYILGPALPANDAPQDLLQYH